MNYELILKPTINENVIELLIVFDNESYLEYLDLINENIIILDNPEITSLLESLLYRIKDDPKTNEAFINMLKTFNRSSEFSEVIMEDITIDILYYCDSIAKDALDLIIQSVYEVTGVFIVLKFVTDYMDNLEYLLDISEL